MLGDGSIYPALSIRRGLSWSIVGSLASFAGSWGFVLVLIHGGEPELVGQYGLAMAIGAPILALTNFQLRGLLATDASREFSFGDYLGLRLIGMVISAFTMTIVLTLSDFNRSVIVLAAIIAVRRAVESISDIYYGLFQRQELQNLIAQASMWSTLLNLVVFGAVFVMTDDLAWALSGTIVTSLVLLMLHNIPHARRLEPTTQGVSENLSPDWNAFALRRLFLQAIPLTLVSSLLVLDQNVPRYVLAAQSDLDQLGIFVALGSLLVAVNIFSNAVAQTISPRLAIHVATNNKREFTALILKTELGALVASLGAIGLAYVIGPEVISWIYEPRYSSHEAGIVMLALSAGMAVMGQFLANANTAARRLNVQVPITILALLILTLGCLWLVPEHGVDGAIAAITIAMLVRLVSHGVVFWRFIAHWS